MARGEIYLGVDAGTLQLLSALGRTYEVRSKQYSKSDRTASAKLVRDVIATKKTFTLAYSMIDGDDLDTYKDLYDEDSKLLLRVYTDDSNYEDFTVLMEPIDYERILMFDDGLWGNVDIVLEEV